VFETKEDILVTENELMECLGIGRGLMRRMWQTGLRFVQIRDSRGTRFYLGSDVISWFKAQSQEPDSLPLVRVKGARYERVTEEGPEE
jgi:hypothetical protein